MQVVGQVHLATRVELQRLPASTKQVITGASSNNIVSPTKLPITHLGVIDDSIWYPAWTEETIPVKKLVKITIGNDQATVDQIEKLGSQHIACTVDDFIVDEKPTLFEWFNGSCVGYCVVS